MTFFGISSILKKIFGSAIIFSTFMCFSSAWALGRMDASDPPSIFHYTFGHLCWAMFIVGIFIAIKVWICGFFLSDENLKRILKINFVVTAALAILFSTMQGNVAVCFAKKLAPTMVQLTSDSEANIFLSLFILVTYISYCVADFLMIKTQEKLLKINNYAVFFISNAILTGVVTFWIGWISLVPFSMSSATTIYFPFGNFCRI